MAYSIKGGCSSESHSASSSSVEDKKNQKLVDWRAYGGNAVYASKYGQTNQCNLPSCSLIFRPDLWQESLNDYHYWEVIQVWDHDLCYTPRCYEILIELTIEHGDRVHPELYWRSSWIQ